MRRMRPALGPEVWPGQRLGATSRGDPSTAAHPASPAPSLIALAFLPISACALPCSPSAHRSENGAEKSCAVKGKRATVQRVPTSTDFFFFSFPFCTVKQGWLRSLSFIECRKPFSGLLFGSCCAVWEEIQVGYLNLVQVSHR